MTYESIDPIINAWATKHRLHVYTEYRDDKVRSVEVVGVDGHKCQIWIDAPDQNGNVEVHVWDYRKKRENYKTDVAGIARALEQAHAAATKWLS